MGKYIKIPIPITKQEKQNVSSQQEQTACSQAAILQENIENPALKMAIDALRYIRTRPLQQEHNSDFIAAEIHQNQELREPQDLLGPRTKKRRHQLMR